MFTILIYRYIIYYIDFYETPKITIRPFKVDDRLDISEIRNHCQIDKSEHYLVKGYKNFTQHDQYLDSLLCLIIDPNRYYYYNYYITFLKESKYTNDSTTKRTFRNYSIYHDKICEYKLFKDNTFSKTLYHGERYGLSQKDVICK